MLATRSRRVVTHHPALPKELFRHADARLRGAEDNGRESRFVSRGVAREEGALAAPPSARTLSFPMVCSKLVCDPPPFLLSLAPTPSDVGRPICPYLRGLLPAGSWKN